jgi:hypothetical protein
MELRSATETTEMERRAFLRSMGLSAAFLLETAFPTSKPGLLGTEQLTRSADRLARLRVLDHQKSAAVVATDAAELAQSLLMQLKITPQADPLRRQLALLTGQAADLAGVSVEHLGEPGPALAWMRVVEACGRQAGSPDLTGWGVLAQAGLLQHFFDGADQALGLMHQRAPREGLSAPVRAMLEAVRSAAAAGSSHPLPKRERWTKNALERSQDAIADVDANPTALPFVPWLGASHISGIQGRAYLLLGYGDAAYEVLSGGLRDHPPELYRGLGGKYVKLAHAAFLTGDLERACAHAAQAHRIMSEAPSALYGREFRELRDVDLAPYAGAAAVRQLDEQIAESRTTASSANEAPAKPKQSRRSYVKVRARGGVWKLHTAECSDGLRAKRRIVFAPAEGRRPDRIAANPRLRPDVVPCGRCIGPLW